MARLPAGSAVLERARQDIARAKTIEQLRIAQAVVLPLDHGLSLAETGRVIGRSQAWVARERTRYIRGAGSPKDTPARGGRRHALMSEQEEMELVRQAVMNSAYSFTGGVRDEARQLLEKKVGPDVSESTLSGILSRVARKTIPNGTTSDLQRMSAHLTEKWRQERRSKR